MIVNKVSKCLLGITCDKFGFKIFEDLIAILNNRNRQVGIQCCFVFGVTKALGGIQGRVGEVGIGNARQLIVQIKDLVLVQGSALVFLDGHFEIISQNKRLGGLTPHLHGHFKGFADALVLSGDKV